MHRIIDHCNYVAMSVPPGLGASADSLSPAPNTQLSGDLDELAQERADSRAWVKLPGPTVCFGPGAYAGRPSTW